MAGLSESTPSGLTTYRGSQGSAPYPSTYQQRQVSSSNSSRYGAGGGVGGGSTGAARSPRSGRMQGGIIRRSSLASSESSPPAQGMVSLPSIATAVGESSVWFSNAGLMEEDDSNSGGYPSGVQGGVVFQQGIRHGGDDGMLPPMSFGRLPQQIYDGLLPTTPGSSGPGGRGGSADLASFSLRNIGSTFPPVQSSVPLPSLPLHSPSNIGGPISNHSMRHFDEDLHRLFNDGGAANRLGTQSQSHSQSHFPRQLTEDTGIAARLRLPPPKVRSSTAGDLGGSQVGGTVENQDDRDKRDGTI